MTITAHPHLVLVTPAEWRFTGPCPEWCDASHAGDDQENWFHHSAPQAIDTWVSGTPLTVTMADSSDNRSFPGPMVSVGKPDDPRQMLILTLAEAEALGSMLADFARRGYNGAAESHDATLAELDGPDYAAILAAPLLAR
jgi:hypothetical protein